MKRRLLIAAVFLLAGAVVNVAVAWGLAACLDIDGGYETVQTVRHWHVYRQEKPGLVLVISQRFARTPDDLLSHPLLPRNWLRGMKHRPDEPVYGLVPYFTGVAWGWPCKALWHDWETVTVPQVNRNLKNAIPLPSTIVFSRLDRVYSWPRGLPLRFVVPGFAVNTLLYATVFWLLICGPFALRRVIRVRRGLCPACAYPMGESDVCSECGKALPRRARVTT